MAIRPSTADGHILETIPDDPPGEERITVGEVSDSDGVDPITTA
jgi:hypothetical protein